MKRVNDIINNPIYKQELEKIMLSEKNRKFCRHTLEHFIDTARIAYIMCLENGVDIEKETVYAAALLHDIGRYRQYKYGIPHNEAGAEIAKGLIGAFNEREQELILSAIYGHRKGGGDDFCAIFRKADKLSRLCFECSAHNECNWNDEKKNNMLKY